MLFWPTLKDVYNSRNIQSGTGTVSMVQIYPVREIERDYSDLVSQQPANFDILLPFLGGI